MPSKSLTFFLGFLAFLFLIILCFPEPVTAQPIALPLLQSDSPLGANGFIVYGRATVQGTAGIEDRVRYETVSLRDLEEFFDFGGTLELLTTDPTLTKYDIVMSEIMWGLDRGITTDPQVVQWIELYNTTAKDITGNLFFLFPSFKNYLDRRAYTDNAGNPYVVLDAVSNLHLGRWGLPGQSGRRAVSADSFVTTAHISAYRNIDYAVVEDGKKNRDGQLAGVPFGSYPESWKATPRQGRRNVLPEIEHARIAILYVATPGTKHTPEAFITAVPKTSVLSNRVVINEVRNDTSRFNLDWIELKNISRVPMLLEKWELSIVTQDNSGPVPINTDSDFVSLPDYELFPGEILLIVNQYPHETFLAGGINIARPYKNGATYKYFVYEALVFPDTGKFMLLLRSENDKNGMDVAIEDYAGNGFFADPLDAFRTEFWPRAGQRKPTDVADFGANTFASFDKTWARVRYQADDGHHKDAWEAMGSQGGIGYDVNVDLSVALGTPGYENDALKTRITIMIQEPRLLEMSMIPGKLALVKSCMMRVLGGIRCSG